MAPRFKTIYEEALGIEVTGAQRKYFCDFPGCPLSFRTNAELLLHRDAPEFEHHWCDKCKVWCKDWEGFIQHKTLSANHLSCPVCGLDYKSEAGLNIHMKTKHPPSKNLICVGCRKVFHQIAPLIAHLEKGRCPGITIDKYQGAVARKEIISEVLNKPDRYAPSPLCGPQNSAESSKAGDTSAWGVGSELLESGAEEAETIKALKPLPSTPTTIADNLAATQSTISDLEWPSPVDTAFTGTGMHSKAFPLQEDTSSKDALSPAMSNLSLEGSSTGDLSSPSQTKPQHFPNKWFTPAGSWSSANTASKLFPGAKPNTAPKPTPTTPEKPTSDAEYLPFSAVDSSGRVYTTNLFTTKLWDESWQPDSPNFSAEKFFNGLIQRYECPFKHCSDTFEAPTQLSAHLQLCHTTTEFLCPRCGRQFKSRAGVAAHCESWTSRCSIGGTAMERRLMDRISGGYVALAEKEGNNGTPRQKEVKREWNWREPTW